MKSIVIRLAKRHLIKTVNDLLADNRENVEKITQTIGIWTERLSKVLECLKRISERVSDGKLESGEADDSLAEIEALIRGF